MEWKSESVKQSVRPCEQQEYDMAETPLTHGASSWEIEIAANERERQEERDVQGDVLNPD